MNTSRTKVHRPVFSCAGDGAMRVCAFILLVLVHASSTLSCFKLPSQFPHHAILTRVSWQFFGAVKLNHPWLRCSALPGSTWCLCVQEEPFFRVLVGVTCGHARLQPGAANSIVEAAQPCLQSHTSFFWPPAEYRTRTWRVTCEPLSEMSFLRTKKTRVRRAKMG